MAEDNKAVKRPYPRTGPCFVECRGDGNQICALIGENIQEGAAGFGDDLPSALRDLADELEREVGQTPQTGQLAERDREIERLKDEIEKMRVYDDAAIKKLQVYFSDEQILRGRELVGFHREVERLNVENEKLREGLRKLEWNGWGSTPLVPNLCPSCYSAQPGSLHSYHGYSVGHKLDCWLEKLLVEEK